MSNDKKIELNNKIKNLENELKKLKKKKYGLVWEEKKEKFDKDSKNALPVLKEKGGKYKDVISDPSDNFNVLIEGDNYHSLSVLSYTHKNKVDVIYIDPPYNTGAQNWKYNNRYVDKDDTYRHSKWISFMNKRLRLAREILKDDGVLICAIDENEYAHLSVLVEDIFNGYEQHTVVVLHNPKGVQGTNFSYTHEYALFVIPKGKKVINNRILDESEIYVSNLRNWGSESLRSDAKNCFYPIFVKDEKIIGFGDVCPDNFHPKGRNVKQKDGSIFVYPVDDSGTERKWRYARQSVEDILGVLNVKKTRGSDLDIVIAKNYGTYKTVWLDKKYDASEHGTKHLKDIIPNCDFDFPKSIYTVFDSIYAVVGKKKDAIVLDFFAGSGTTGEAVLKINEKDDGNRKFILATNNENGICEDVTFPRVKNIIKGYKNKKDEKVKGTGGNLKYLKTDFLKIDKVNDNLRRKMVDRSTEILCLKESTFNIKTDLYKEKKIKIFFNSDKYSAILFDTFYFDDFVNEIKKLKDKPISVYVFSHTNTFPREEFGDINVDFTVEAIPEKILETYKKIFNF